MDNWRGIIKWAAVGFGVLLLNPVRVIPDGEACSRIRLGKVQEASVYPGITLTIPLAEGLSCMSTRSQSLQAELTAATSNLQDLNAKVALEWRLPPSSVPQVQKMYGSMDQFRIQVLEPKVADTFKSVSATRNLDDAISKRSQLKADWEGLIRKNLATYPSEIIGLDVVNLSPSELVSKSIESKEVAAQQALEKSRQADGKVNLARGIRAEADAEAYAIRVKAEALRAAGSSAVLEKELIEAWKAGGSKVPEVLSTGGDGGFWLSRLIRKP